MECFVGRLFSENVLLEGIFRRVLLGRFFLRDVLLESGDFFVKNVWVFWRGKGFFVGRVTCWKKGVSLVGLLEGWLFGSLWLKEGLIVEKV